MLSLPLIVMLLAVGGRVCAWDNSWDGPLHRPCPSGEVVYSIESKHDNDKEDRKWDIGCRSAGVSLDYCYWTGYVNDFDERIDFSCPTNYVITGMYSYHSNRDEDRRWKYRCCRSSQLRLTECRWTPRVNYWDEWFYWQLPGSNYYLTGVDSYHRNDKEDRRWKFQYCRRR